MQVHSLSIVTGSSACNARCPFCVSKMTPNCGVGTKVAQPNWRNFDKAVALAKSCGVNTVLLTSKGEPTLFPMQVSDYLMNLDNEFPVVELQTNGLKLHEPDMDEYLKEWYDYGLTMVNVSVVSAYPELNQRIYTGEHPYPNLVSLIEKLHDSKLSVRLSVTMLDGYMSTWEQISDFLKFAKRLDVEQVTMRPVAAPTDSEDPGTAEWVRRLKLSAGQIKKIDAMFAMEGTLLLTLPHGGCVYDVDGQNVCWTDCLTLPKRDQIRQLIYFPDGHLRYDWQHPGAIIF